MSEDDGQEPSARALLNEMEAVHSDDRMHPLIYAGSVGTIFGIWLLNFVLSIVTIGIYSFWGKTRMRRYIAGSFTLLGDRFDYTGTGKELFFGFLKALPFIIILYAPIIIYPPEVYPITNLMFILFYFLILVAIYAATRYRLSRTTWRGIRGRLSGSAFGFAFRGLGVGVLNILTLGLFIPKGDEILLRYQMGHVWFGNTPGRFTGTAKELWSSHLITLLLAIPTLGISRLWYAATVFRFQLNHFSVGGIKFKADPTGWDLFLLLVGNLLIVLLTLGFGTPIAINRNMKYLARHVSLRGDLEAAAAEIVQSQEELGSSGEGLDGALGLDSGLF